MSNVAFLGRNSILVQLQEYLDRNDLENIFQSAYRKYHCTETTLIHEQNDMLRAIDAKSEVAIALLDLTATFDTINHQILFDRLKNMYNIESIARWSSSYLSDRQQKVTVGQVSSRNQP